MSNIIPVPRFVLPLRVLQFVFALAILGMSAYGLYWVRFDVCPLLSKASLHSPTNHHIYRHGVSQSSP